MIKSSPKKNLKNDSDDLAFQDEAPPRMKRKLHKGFSKTATNFKTNKKGRKTTIAKGKAKIVDKKEYAGFYTKLDDESNLEKANVTNILTENKLVTTKPWFSKSELVKSDSESRKKNLESVSSMSSDIRPNKNSSTHSSSNIYDTTVNVNASTTLQRSLSASDSFSGRSMCPRIA